MLHLEDYYYIYGVISVLVEGYYSTLILSVRNEPNNIYYWWNKQNKKERAENWGGRVDLNKRWTIC